jgi:6,7-dimethyl-8-ribityllumazine synthase
LAEYGVTDIITITVPGAIEIPFAIKAFYEGNTELKADVFITLGCVIQGDTPHFEYVCRSVTDGVTQLNLSLNVPVIFGVLTVNTQEQAEERIGGKHGHKGEEAAVTALKMIALNLSLKK